MFCEQCEQTASGNGCHQWGACGKSPEVNAVQDLLVYCLRGLASVVLKAKEARSTRRAGSIAQEGLYTHTSRADSSRVFIKESDDTPHPGSKRHSTINSQFMYHFNRNLQ